MMPTIIKMAPGKGPTATDPKTDVNAIIHVKPNQSSFIPMLLRFKLINSDDFGGDTSGCGTKPHIGTESRN